MNIEFLKNKFKILLILLVVIIVFIIGFLIYKNSKEKLILVCESNATTEGISANISLSLYKKSKNLRIIQSLNFDINDKSNDELNITYKLLKQQLNKKIENQFGKNYEYITIDSDYDEKNIIIDIIYDINLENKEDMELVFGCSVLDSSTTKLKKCFEDGDLKCKKY